MVVEQLIRIGTTYLPVQNVEEAAEWYTAKLGAQLNYKDERINITVSIGVATFNEVEDMHELIKLADKRLYISKSKGKNRVC